MRCWFCGVLFAFASTGAVAEDANRLVISLAWTEIAGTGADARDEFDKVISDFDEARRHSLGLEYAVGNGWSLGSKYQRASFEYESPLGGRCQPVAGILLGDEFCRPSSTIRAGSIEDEYSSISFWVTKRWRLGERFGALGSIGYERAEWSSPDDIEAETYTSCERFYSLPGTPISGCNPLPRETHVAGLTGRVAGLLEFGSKFELEVGVNWEQERYRIYRNETAPRFCAQNPRERGFCNALDAFVPASAFADDDWYWWSSALIWRPRATPWSFVLRAEAGGTRDWRILTCEVKYHW